MRKRVILLSVLGIVVIMAFLFAAPRLWQRPQPEETHQEIVTEAVASVSVHSVERGPVYRAYTAVGNLVPKELARITPKVGGRISQVPVDEGDAVRDGSLLMQIEAFDYRRSVENATALMNRSRVNLNKAKRDSERMQRLRRDHTISEQQYRDIKTVEELAQYSYDQALVALRKSERDLKECRVLSPIEGIVTSRNVHEGELTGPQVAAFVIMQMDTLEAEIDLPEEAYGYVGSGDPCHVTVDAFPGETFEGVITMIYPTVDPASRTVRVTVTLENPDLRLRAGMTARAKVIQKARDNTVFAPRASFIKGEEGYFVYKVLAGRIKKADVKIGVHGDGVFEATQGLAPGDQVVIEGFTGLRDDLAVTVTSQGSSALKIE